MAVMLITARFFSPGRAKVQKNPHLHYGIFRAFCAEAAKSDNRPRRESPFHTLSTVSKSRTAPLSAHPKSEIRNPKSEIPPFLSGDVIIITVTGRKAV
ncbi:MAG: hypothetical protein JSS81_17155 [Acidobacteria bacterium]|nr:hypothetical protein [Acidobacteriota bacterium]